MNDDIHSLRRIAELFRNSDPVLCQRLRDIANRLEKLIKND